MISIAHQDNYTQYKRRKAPEPGDIFDPEIHGYKHEEPSKRWKKAKILVNRYVVPHNKFLVNKYGAQ